MAKRIKAFEIAQEMTIRYVSVRGQTTALVTHTRRNRPLRGWLEVQILPCGYSASEHIIGVNFRTNDEVDLLTDQEAADAQAQARREMEQ